MGWWVIVLRGLGGLIAAWVWFGGLCLGWLMALCFRMRLRVWAVGGCGWLVFAIVGVVVGWVCRFEFLVWLVSCSVVLLFGVFSRLILWFGFRLYFAAFDLMVYGLRLPGFCGLLWG